MSNQQKTDYSDDDDDNFENDANVEIIEFVHGQTDEGN